MDRDISEMYEDELVEYLSDKLDEINGKIERGELVEVKRGRWVNMEDGDYSCTNCKETIVIDIDMSPIDDCELYFCPYCGADMKGGAE